MEIMIKYLTTFVIIFLASSSFGQMTNSADLQETRSNSLFGVKPVSNLYSLIDLSKVRWSNSYSLSFFSGGTSSGTFGMFRTNMFYDVSSKLTVGLNLSLSHNSGSLLNRYSLDNNNASLFPGFMLDYHPSENFTFRIDYRRVDGSNPYNYRRYWYIRTRDN